jgi:hypothetical protein
MLLGLTMLLLAPTVSSAATSPPLDPALCAPDANAFTLTIDNPYFPLPVGQQWVYSGKEQGGRSVFGSPSSTRPRRSASAVECG